VLVITEVVSIREKPAHKKLTSSGRTRAVGRQLRGGGNSSSSSVSSVSSASRNFRRQVAGHWIACDRLGDAIKPGGVDQRRHQLGMTFGVACAESLIDPTDRLVEILVHHYDLRSS
jgi:hypothetical protein